MLKSYKYRLYPTREQSDIIDRTIGCCRLVYNLALEVKIRAYREHQKILSAYDLQKQLTEMKQVFPFLYEVGSQATNAAINSIDIAFRNFYNGGGYPKFKSKKNKGSFQCPYNLRKIDWVNSTLSIPKIKDIPIELSRPSEGQIKTVTISKTPTGKYFASILVDNKTELPAKPEIKQETTVGIDIGIKSFVVTSYGKFFEQNRKLKDSLKRLKCLQRRASRKKKGSNNRKKANLCVAILHEKITNQRTDYVHKITTQLIRDNQAESFVIEDLNVVGMLKNRKLSQAISDVSFGEFFRQMKYKCDWYGKNLITIGRFEPSSKTCSDCGQINNTLSLADREWICANCGSVHERDFNAAKNIKRIGLEKYSGRGTSGEPAELPSMDGAMKQEAKNSTPTL